MKTLFKNNSKVIIFIIIGALFTSLSFVWEYIINYNNFFFTCGIIILDIILLLINIYYLSFLVTEKVGRSIINSIIFSILYFTFITGCIMCIAEDSASLELLIGTIRILIYLAPSIIILLPVMYLCCLVLD